MGSLKNMFYFPKSELILMHIKYKVFSVAIVTQNNRIASVCAKLQNMAGMCIHLGGNVVLINSWRKQASTDLQLQYEEYTQ